ncbi:MAG: tetratricopeptide repeat protein [Candidatus Berkiellales bacterium]
MRILASILIIIFSSTLFAFGTDEDSNADPKVKLAQEFISKKEFDKAVPILTEVVTADPKNADAYNYLGFSYRNLGKMDEALKNYQMALSIDPNHKGANEYLGELYLQKGDLPKAEERLQALDKACPSDCIEHKTLKEQIDNFKKNSNKVSKNESDSRGY